MSNTQIAAMPSAGTANAICSQKTGIEVKSENVINKDATNENFYPCY
ncbi:hypothetical protein GXM_01349 [Nostoc sphaeroides CCNUC1]|uniref:Uncharacterized protein n=1 Tax=Nostoc sphaeroides CCNUC1 TaxID=2653204 RepID=A0A5P8VUQ3_9NOSO|nr:hypothetical protein GXM_01349 [Nostoc sphaeroides CCNUC1]